MCPCETPDGGKVGIRKNLSVTTHISFYVASDDVEKAIWKYGDIIDWNRFMALDVHERCSCVAVFVQHRLLGWTMSPQRLFTYMKLLKRNGFIHCFTSISWDYLKNQMFFSTDSGRCCRPVYTAKDGVLDIAKKYKGKHKTTPFSWTDLVTGTHPMSMSRHNNKAEENNRYIYQSSFVDIDGEEGWTLVELEETAGVEE